MTASIPSDPNLDSISARISQDSILAYDTYLQDLQTRNVYTVENDQAQAYLEAKFASFGYTDVTIDSFDVYGWTAHNVICTKLGTTEPDKVIVIGGHYDSYNGDSDPLVYAPGADDNGSGTVCVLEIARALADIPTKKTIIFVAFDGEEYGLYGSE
ncbi:MAG: M28 family peptidase, partial [candidate division Zixibacteria bacterium]|nr:M28 family peptidase [candidate division Zixibacteria bacterium]